MADNSFFAVGLGLPVCNCSIVPTPFSSLTPTLFHYTCSFPDYTRYSYYNPMNFFLLEQKRRVLFERTNWTGSAESKEAQGRQELVVTLSDIDKGSARCWVPALDRAKLDLSIVHAKLI